MSIHENSTKFVRFEFIRLPKAPIYIFSEFSVDPLPRRIISVLVKTKPNFDTPGQFVNFKSVRRLTKNELRTLRLTNLVSTKKGLMKIVTIKVSLYIRIVLNQLISMYWRVLIRKLSCTKSIYLHNLPNP